MKKVMSYAWWSWAILVLGLGLVGACSDNNPTTPGPSDVQDIEFEGGGGIGHEDITDLLDVYNNLVDLGGGATYVEDESGQALIGAFDRWSGEGLDGVHLIIQQPGEAPFAADFNDVAIVSNLTFPITVSVWHGAYIAQTLVETDANIIAFGLEHLWNCPEQAAIIGSTMSYEPDGLPWMVRAKSTHQNWDWVCTHSLGPNGPSTLVFANAYQPVGAVAFIYHGLPLDEWISDNMEDPANYELLGYSYSHIGSLDPGAVGGWIMNYTQSGSGNTYNSGNYTVQHTFPLGTDSAPLGHAVMTLTPGGIREDNLEFIPFYPPTEVGIHSDSGTYDMKSFDPPCLTDRNVIVVEVEYVDGATEWMLVDFDPLGTDLPDINLGTVPVWSSFEVTNIDYPALFAEWTNDPAAGLQVVTLTDAYGNTYWEIYTDSAATQLPVEGIAFPDYDPDSMTGLLATFVEDPRISVSRIECPGVSPDAFDNNTVWNGTTVVSSSVTEQIEPDYPLP